MLNLDRVRLSTLPTAGKVLLTAFLALVGGGYLSAVANLYFQHRMKDRNPALTFDDLVLNFHGGEAGGDAEDPSLPSAAVETSIMLEMVSPGGEMRDELEDGGDPAVRTLIAWLKAGAEFESFDKPGLVEAGDPSPKDVLTDNCVDCHGPYGEREDAPFGGDDFVAQYSLVQQYAAPPVGGTTVSTAEATPSTEPTTSGPSARRVEPQSVSHLALVTHIHMLSIPVFALIVGGLVLLTGLPRGLRGTLAVVPMVTLLFDFSSWWIARAFAPATYVIAAAGAVFGITLAVQLLVVLGSMWFGKRPLR